VAGEAIAFMLLRRLDSIEKSLEGINLRLGTLATKADLMTTNEELLAYINTVLVPAWQGIEALGGQFSAELTNLEAQIASLTAQLAAAGAPVDVDETPSLTVLQNLAAQMTSAASQGAAQINQTIAPLNAAAASSSTVPGAPAPGVTQSVAVSGAPVAAASLIPAVAPIQPDSASGPSDTPPSPANK
jgi:hypothetical protein